MMLASAAVVADTLVAQFSYAGGTANTDVAGDKDAGYAVTMGQATVHNIIREKTDGLSPSVFSACSGRTLRNKVRV